jgi:hypothetical protein
MLLFILSLKICPSWHEIICFKFAGLPLAYLRAVPYGIAVDTAKAVDTAIALQFYFMSTAKMQ